jgi:MFS family permease
MGLNAGVLSLGIVAYPFLGGALGLLGWNWPFLLSLAAFPVAWLCWRRLDVSTAGSDERLVDYIRRAGRLVSGRNFVGLFLATFLTFILLYGPVITFYPFLAAERFGLESFTIGLLVSVSSVFSAVAAAQLGWLTGFFRERTLILTGFVLYAVCFLITPAVNVAWLLAVPLAIFGTAQGLNIPSIITSMNRRAGNENRGAVMAVNATLLRAGQAAGPALAGLVQTGFGLDGIYVAAAILACVAFATTVALVR